MRVEDWIALMTKGSPCVLDLGAGPGSHKALIPPGACYHGIDRFAGYGSDDVAVADMRDTATWCHDKRHTAMLIDSLEHVGHSDGENLLLQLQEMFQRILVFTPDGLHVQECDVTGKDNPYQRHECGWKADELCALGFTCSVDPDYHTGDPDKPGMIFGVWSR